MSYLDIADMAVDPDLNRRIRACLAQERYDPVETSATTIYWRLAAHNDWAASWASARAGNVIKPGASPDVITDQMILSGVQAERAGELSRREVTQ